MNGYAVGNHHMWQDGSLAVDHENATEFVTTILNALGAPNPSNPPCPPQAKREDRRMERTTMQGWLLCFPRPKSWYSDFIRTDVLGEDRHS